MGCRAYRTLNGIGFAAALLSFTRWPAGAQTLRDRAEQDTTAKVRTDDIHMEEAYRKARETLPEFLRLARAPRPTITSYAVKIGIPHSEGREFFWMSPLEFRTDDIIGRINNTPQFVTSVKAGQRIIFKEKDIVDWLYRENGRMHGNFTACALARREPPREARAFMLKYGLICD